MFNNLRIKLKVFWKNLFSKRSAQPRFINPYAMTEPETPKYYVQPKFKDGRFILEKEEAKKQNAIIKSNGKKEKAEKNGGMITSLVEVVIEDLEGLSGEAKKRAKREAFDKEKYNAFKELAEGKR